MKTITKFSCLFLLSTVAQCLFGETPVEWPNGKKGAIVLTYDDALSSHLRVAIPQLDEKSLKATFFLHGAGIRQREIAEWKMAALTGHELGNHSMYHPCLSKDSLNDERYVLESYTVGSIGEEIAMMNNYLYCIDGETVRTYAYPCGQTETKDGDYSEMLKNSQLVIAARMVGDSRAVVDRADMPDLCRLPAFVAGTGDSGEKLIDFVKRVEKRHGFGIFVFHGVGGDYLDVSAESHQALVNYLSDHSDSLWVTTFRELSLFLMKEDEKNPNGQLINQPTNQSIKNN
ncbi:MAG: polysaccharide deacetylase family protein [Prevotellaceae bacterium]|jgi:peptidoglycan/xylan/chitin deacetylase (PgdA/CDA1 family)|nr:polysaccharide deacetylase family protein [Prevotellaceae bacterium]